MLAVSIFRNRGFLTAGITVSKSRTHGTPTPEYSVAVEASVQAEPHHGHSVIAGPVVLSRGILTEYLLEHLVARPSVFYQFAVAVIQAAHLPFISDPIPFAAQ